MFTERLHIRQVKFPLDDQVLWMNDPRNTEYSEQRHKVHDKVSCANYIRSCSIFWGIQDVDSGEWIGTMSSHIDDNNGVADLGIMIHHEWAGSGFGTEAWKAACAHLLKDVRKIEAGCMANNLPMRKVFEKSKMFYEGERKAHFLFEGGYVGLVQYGMWK